jgi:hypothetical protein
MIKITTYTYKHDEIRLIEFLFLKRDHINITYFIYNKRFEVCTYLSSNNPERFKDFILC